MGEPQMRKIVELMDMALMNPTKKAVIDQVKDQVLELCQEFPINKKF
jgi:glycine/serine hydroxymethyltransferase